MTRGLTLLRFATAVFAIGALAVLPLCAGAQQQQQPFPHPRHANVFPLCTTCHAGVVELGQSLWPSAAQCAACHDGTVEQRVPWTPREGPRAGNRRFTHDAHDRAVTVRNPADSALIANCSSCHNTTGAPRMTVQHAVVGNCLDCHGLREPHVDVAPAECATCHVRLTDAPSLTRANIAAFPRPSSHSAPGFLLGGHGRAATVTAAGGGRTIAASCATCHARNLCLQCHVNAPESPVIRALALDARSPDYSLEQPVPASHSASGFVRAHGQDAARSEATCANCHTRESCGACHTVLPPAAARLASAGPGRAHGARIVRAPPSTHTWEFRERHGAEANVRTATCETCHTRSTCLECHRPSLSRASTFHPRGFITRHPSAAYARAANCSDCHNTAQFCQSCHQQSGLVARGRLGRSGYHDAFRGFSLGHGQAARQNLESCVGCHVERDCAACHASAAAGGFGFSPHGPGFNAARARSKNATMCTACHVTAR